MVGSLYFPPCTARMVPRSSLSKCVFIKYAPRAQLHRALDIAFVGCQNDDLSVRNGAPGGKELFAQMREYAKVLLSLVARRENQTELTRKLLEELSAEFPANPLFHRELALVK